MKPSRLFYASMMTFWMVFLSMLALVYTYTPQGGVQLAGLVLFANTGLIEPALAAMTAIGLSVTTQSVLLGLLGGFNLGAAGLVLFSMLFACSVRKPNNAMPGHLQKVLRRVWPQQVPVQPSSLCLAARRAFLFFCNCSRLAGLR